MKCPNCNSGQIRQRRDGMCRCHLCGHGFSPNEAKERKPKETAQRGSGAIAGKIVIGRGSMWGAGW
jgi:uncharacterized Zn finger protein (UPF0148 family)